MSHLLGLYLLDNLSDFCNKTPYKSRQFFSFNLSNSESNEIKHIKNTARFRLIDVNHNINKKTFFYKNLKIIISSAYINTNVSGTLEVNTSFYGQFFYNPIEEPQLVNKKINYLSDTKATKCLNVDFEFIDNEYIDLVIRYNQNLNNFTVFIFSDDKPVENPVISYEDISKIQEWY